VAGGELEGACPGHNFTLASIPPTLRSRRLKLCTVVVDSLVCVAVFAGRSERRGWLVLQQLRQLCKNGRDPPRLVPRKQSTAAMSETRLFFEIHVGEGLPVQIFHDKTGVQFLDRPRLRKVALRHSLLKHARHPSAPLCRRSLSRLLLEIEVYASDIPP
jgi:hypothetical protein